MATTTMQPVVVVEEHNNVTSAAAAPTNNGKVVPGGRSVCVFGWFFASEKELGFVEKKYRQLGFDDVTIVPSDVSTISRPRGWYRTYIARHIEQNSVGSPLAR